jgi:signal transduction histidine kinase
MRRLYLQIQLTLLATLALFAVLSWVTWIVLRPDPPGMPRMHVIAALVGDRLPPPGAPSAEVQAGLQALAERFDDPLTLRGADGGLLAAVGEPLPAPEPRGPDETFVPPRRFGGDTIAFRLPDGRWLVARSRHAPPHAALLAVLLSLVAAAAIGAYPFVRRTTRRLERLRERVEALGAGDLSARVEVEGRDEVAELAQRFNAAAERIERLVGAQRTLLASASHELRSPLARIRMAVEMLGADDRPALRAEIERDIAELDDLIEEILLASRLDARATPERHEDVDLLALLAEECARADAELEGAPTRIVGDARTLRRLVRNLLENARRHGGGAKIEAAVEPLADGGARLRVDDRGPGVPEAERERIFEPFYRPAGMREGEGGGVGLGLALVARIARHHGGTARCLPRPGGGSRFEVVLAPAPPALHTTS